MKKLIITLSIFAAIGFFGYRALMNWTVDINPASIARSMTPAQRAEACVALSGGTQGGYEVCMEGMNLARNGIQNPAIPDLSQPATWANYKPGYTMEMRAQWVASYANDTQPIFGACLFDMVASSISFERFNQIRILIKNDVDPRSLPDFSMAMNDCSNGTFNSLQDNSASTDESSNQIPSQTTLPYATDRNTFWNANCPKTLRQNDQLPLVKCDKGAGVRHMQRLLGVNPDSYYGNDTFNAVIDFQSRSGLPVTGNIDEETWRAIDPTQSGPGVDRNSDGLVTPDEFS